MAVAGVGGVPAGPASAVALNVTIVNPTAPTYLTVWPSGQPQPASSNVNAVVGTVANMVTVGLGADGALAVSNYAGSADILIDVAGWFDGAGGVAGASGCVASGPPAAPLTSEAALPPKWPLTAVVRGTPKDVVAALQEPSGTEEGDPLIELASLNGPTADIDQILAEIESGRR